ncbi:hypothetical protein AGABI1DRAFT_111277 [Agaricus bisporus var. burnettii JB137-S8]|uniref:Ketoreductase domain-containing protein n=2 Tax=Agaricus bisporus var. burnettii TaxID=192524 RepID=K5W785_AGABU|nr:uncharacterized protein AGABI1DRAFT_111277 [Agaricus bisporus var. burnettii JB137-S8]EKM82699.1 hypothetical protein AGABI1DRAFT_111277 [Agaricus bisporus var. burnettii JB137-S8]KAF7778741.1 hypothetical protein Agabi119p4_3086 [Agaricus bisporus var. burnettii]
MSVFNATRLIGKTVIVTGASSGIGAATAVLFAKAGSNVILVARRQEILKQVADQCLAAHKESGLTQGGKFATVQLDVSDKTQVAGFLDKVPQDLRDIDILVNNAGFVLGLDRIGDIKDSDIEGMFATNVFGLISMTQLLVREFKKKQAGHVINLGSIAGREPYVGGSVYNATKSAVRAFTGALLRELVNTPIRVTEIDPGLVETEFSIVRFRGDTSAAKKVYEGLEPLTGYDIAEEIVWAASRPPHVNIADVLVYPVNQASAVSTYRKPANM